MRELKAGLHADKFFSIAFSKHYNISERFRRAAKRGKFWRGAWEFNVVLNSRQWEIPEHKIIQIYYIVSIFTQFCANVRHL